VRVGHEPEWGTSPACTVEDTKAKYGVHNDDVHNFDKTGF
jgi:hypothetical protein